MSDLARMPDPLEDDQHLLVAYVISRNRWTDGDWSSVLTVARFREGIQRFGDGVVGRRSAMNRGGRLPGITVATPKSTSSRTQFSTSSFSLERLHQRLDVEGFLGSRQMPQQAGAQGDCASDRIAGLNRQARRSSSRRSGAAR